LSDLDLDKVSLGFKKTSILIDYQLLKMVLIMNLAVPSEFLTYFAGGFISSKDFFHACNQCVSLHPWLSHAMDAISIVEFKN
jgi:hypothetical protein